MPLELCYQTVNNGACGTNDTGPALPPCTNCWLWVNTTSGSLFGCKRVTAGLAECLPGPVCHYRHWEYACSDDGKGNRQCVEEVYEHGKIPTSVAAGAACGPPTPQTQPIDP